MCTDSQPNLKTMGDPAVVSIETFFLVKTLTQDEDCVYVEAGGHVVQLNKEDGTVKMDFIPARHRASNVCVGSNMLITGSCPTV